MKTLFFGTKLSLLAALSFPLYFIAGCTSPSPQSDTAWGGAATAPIDDMTHARRYGDVEPFRNEARR